MKYFAVLLFAACALALLYTSSAEGICTMDNNPVCALNTVTGQREVVANQCYADVAGVYSISCRLYEDTGCEELCYPPEA